MICLFIWITVIVGVEEEFVDGDDELVTVEEISFVFVLVTGIGDGDNLLYL